MIRAASYIRVSTERQAEDDKVSLGEQQKDIAAHCEAQDYTIVKEYRDIGSGASKRRAGFQQLLRDVQDGEFDVIVCWKSDRLSRGLYPAAALSEALEGTDIRLESVKDTIDRNTFDIMAVVGKIELGNIRERARMGARGKALRGQVAGTMKFGYGIGEDHKPVIVDFEAQVVQRIFTDYVAGTGCRAIIRGLTNDGIFTRNGNHWSSSRIIEVIANPAYIGSAIYGRKQYYKKDNGDRDVKHHKNMPASSWITVEYPRIIDDETWRLAQAERKNPTRGVRSQGRKHNAVYPLRRLVWCGNCGHKYTAEASYRVQYRTKADGTKMKVPTNDLRRRYVCNFGAKSRCGCPKTLIYANAIEPVVWKAVTDFLTDPAEIRAIVQERQRDLAEGGARTQMDSAQSKLNDVEVERGRVLLQHQHGHLDDAELELKMHSIKERIESHANELHRLSIDGDESKEILRGLDDFIASTQHITERIDTMDEGERAELVKLLVDRVTVNADSCQITMALERAGRLSTASPS